MGGMSQAVDPRRVVRSVSDRWIGGVAGGLAEHFSTPAWVFRLAFVVTALAGGVGIVAYALMWVFLPLDPHGSEASPGPARSTGGWDLTGVLGILALGLGVLLGLAALGLPIRVSLWGPVLIVGAGVILLWRQSDDLQRATIRSRAEEGVQATAALSDRQGWIRVLVGLGLVLLGLVAVVGPQIDLATTGRSMAAAGAVVAGLVLIALPWISTWIKGLEAERYSAVRAEERAEMAARVHDSVLQTLTLIQRRADDPAEVARLARAEERALRSWLYAPVGASGSLGAALAEVVATTEADYDARIELVTVGDTVVDDRIAALVAATREAVLNAAKHAGAPASVYAEVDDDLVEVNVRDRGRGFTPESVDPDRHGVRQSIVDRMASVGGSATVRSTPGEGTEIRLVLPIRGAADA
jgi:signal transduction histidine kinase/phage shock protein PspC (stress-responsive transcriptional regulator)